MNTATEPQSRARARPGIASDVMTTVSFFLGAAGGLALSRKIFTGGTFIAGLGQVLTTFIAGMGLARLAGLVTTGPASHTPSLPAAPAISQPLPEQQQADPFLAHAQALAVSGQGGALDAAFATMDQAGLGHIADAVRRHRRQPAATQAYRTVDAWLTELGKRSPETLTHIQRVLVILGLYAEDAVKHLPEAERDSAIARIIMAGAIHDIGKIAIDPALLHKDKRIASDTLEMHLAAYEQAVAPYPEKAMDMAFLRMANGGRIPFGDSQAAPTMQVQQVMAAIAENPLLSEPEHASPALLASCSAIYDRICQHANQAGIAWLSADQQAALRNFNRRGTLTESEMKRMNAHDAIGNRMTAMMGVNEALGIDPATVNPRLPDSHLSPADKELRDMVHMTDIYEATTGNRAYNTHNDKIFSHQNALHILEKLSDRGRIAKAHLAHFSGEKIIGRLTAAEQQTAPEIPATTIQATTAERAHIDTLPVIAQRG